MDPITHALLGASLGYVAGGRRLGRSAALAGGMAAILPDADVFIRSATDPLLAIEHHRGFTHSLAFVPVGAAVAASVWLIRGAWRRSWVALWCCCLLGYLSHCLLDAATSYGTQLLWPFSRHRSGWDIVSVIDPLFTLMLGISLCLALRVSRLRPAVVGLALSSAYLAIGAFQHARALRAQRELASTRGHTCERFEVMPTLGNNIIWRAIYLHEGRIHGDRIRVGWLARPEIREGWSLPKVDEASLGAEEAARNVRHRSFARFAWFSEGWVARSPGDSSVLADMRYSLSTDAFDPIWGIRFTGPESPTEVEWVNRSRERQIEPGELWQEIIGADARYRPVGTRQPDHSRPPKTSPRKGPRPFRY